MNKNIFYILFGGLLTSFLLVNYVYAFCPVCTVAVAGGVGLARWLKVDDTVSGIWIGGLILSSALWLITWLKTKKYTFFFYQPIIIAATYALIIVPLYYANIMGHPYNTLWGMDRLLVGIIIGSIVFALALLFEAFLRNKNHGKVYFYFQKVVVPLIFLAIASLIFYFWAK